MELGQEWLTRLDLAVELICSTSVLDHERLTS